MKSKADYRLDLRGTITSLALLKTTQTLRLMQTDQVLEIVGRDPDTRTDLFKVIPPFSCELVHMEFVEEGGYCIQLKKIKHFAP